MVQESFGIPKRVRDDPDVTGSLEAIKDKGGEGDGGGNDEEGEKVILFF